LIHYRKKEAADNFNCLFFPAGQLEIAWVELTRLQGGGMLMQMA
jgi:hypothetical protein